MKKIKFRAWDTLNKKMIVGSHLWGVDSYDGACLNHPKDDFEPSWIPMQYTGLKDKNGLTDLYEYDIIDSEGNKKGDYYENPDLLKDSTNFLITEMGCKEWRSAEQEAIKRGCQYAK